MSKENESVKFYKVDVDEAEDVSREVNITAMPTFVLFKNGQEVNRLRGVNPDGLTVSYPLLRFYRRLVLICRAGAHQTSECCKGLVTIDGVAECKPADRK